MTSAGKLPFWQTVYGAHLLTLQNLPNLIRIGWLWLLLLLVADVALHWAFWESEQRALSEGRLLSWGLLINSWLVWTFAGACAAVSWHRLVLAGEVVPASRLAMHRSDVSRYLGWVFFFSLFFVLPLAAFIAWVEATITTDLLASQDVASASELAALEIAASEEADSTGCGCLLFLIPAILLFAIPSYLPVRLSLVLPAVALSNRAFDGKASWRHSKGNFWRLYLGLALVATVPLLPVMLIYWGAGLESAQTLAARLVEVVLTGGWFFVAGLISVTFLSLAYRHFVREPATMAQQ